MSSEGSHKQPGPHGCHYTAEHSYLDLVEATAWATRTLYSKMETTVSSLRILRQFGLVSVSTQEHLRASSVYLRHLQDYLRGQRLHLSTWSRLLLYGEKLKPSLQLTLPYAGRDHRQFCLAFTSRTANGAAEETVVLSFCQLHLTASHKHSCGSTLWLQTVLLLFPPRTFPVFSHKLPVFRSSSISKFSVWTGSVNALFSFSL